MKHLAGKLAASIADQGVSSSTTFALNIVLARWLLPADYGAYSVCWSILMVVGGFHNALILEPMTVVGPAEYQHRLAAYFHVNDRLNSFAVATASSLAFLIARAYSQPAVRSAAYALAVYSAGYFLLLVARRKHYVLNQPIRAFRLSAVYSLVVFVLICAFRLSGHLTVITALLALGVGGLTGLAGISKSADNRITASHIAREHWRYGKWLFASALLAMGALDVQTILLSMLVDLPSAGALRALMNFVVPPAQLITILSIYALPRFSSQAKQWGLQPLLKQAIYFPALLAILLAAYLVLLILFAPQLETLLYNGRMQAYIHWMPLLAAISFVAGIGAAFSTLLRAVQNSQHQFVAGVTGSVVGIACAFLLLRKMGIGGALWSMLAANLSSTLIVIAYYLWFSRRRNA